ncbi:hypothetical protein BDC45DRAFT_564539 [Circinella umbellata]|nr:hypothetical protein BDC45DRAFT_564539 [Circinella umbellata]
MTHDLQFDQGIMKLSSFDPYSKRMETRILCLPDLPALESLEHLFSGKPSIVASSRYAEVFSTSSTPSTTLESNSSTTTALRLTKSFTSKKPMSRAPRRCFSNPSLSRKHKDSSSNKKTTRTTGTFLVSHGNNNSKSTNADMKRAESRRSLSHALHAFTGLLQKAKRSPTVTSRNKQQWHNETWFEEMRLSTEEQQLERPTKKKRVGTHTENWWASSPSVCAAGC